MHPSKPQSKSCDTSTPYLYVVSPLSEPSKRPLIQNVSDWCLQAHLGRWRPAAPLHQRLVWPSRSGSGKWIADRAVRSSNEVTWYFNYFCGSGKLAPLVCHRCYHLSHFLFLSPLRRSQTNSWTRGSTLWRSGKVRQHAKNLNTELHTSFSQLVSVYYLPSAPWVSTNYPLCQAELSFTDKILFKKKNGLCNIMGILQKICNVTMQIKAIIRALWYSSCIKFVQIRCVYNE